MPATPSKPLICYVTDRVSLARGIFGDSIQSLIESVGAAVRAGADYVQIREKGMGSRQLLGIVQDAVLTGPGRIIVNDRADIALAGGAAGVHLSGESAPLSDVVAWLRHGPAGFLVGASCHSLDQARAAEAGGASYIFFGPIFDTPSKRGFGEPQGLARLEAVCGATRIPVIAIGGVNERNAADCIRAGASGIAAIRLFQEARDARQLGDTLAKIHAIPAVK